MVEGLLAAQPALQGSWPAGVALILVGLLECFLGYKVFKVQVAIVCFLAGFGLGWYGLGQTFGMVWLGIVSGIVFGILLCVISLKIYKAGVFIFLAFFAFWAGFAFTLSWVFGLILAVAVGILGIFLVKHILILSTAINGAGMVAGGIAALAGINGRLLPGIITAVLAVLGAIVQYKTNPKQDTPPAPK